MASEKKCRRHKKSTKRTLLVVAGMPMVVWAKKWLCLWRSQVKGFILAPLQGSLQGNWRQTDRQIQQ
jgi:hypothetical protein